MVTSKIPNLFQAEIDKGIPIFAGGRESVDYTPLGVDEAAAVRSCFQNYTDQIARISPTLANTLKLQEEAFIKFAGIAKGSFPDSRPIRYPSEPGSIGVAPIIPAALKWEATPSSDDPCYTSIDGNTWAISLTAGTAAYLLGNGTYNYKACHTDDQHSMVVIAKDGIVEFGTTPKFNQIHIKTDVLDKYAPLCTTPLQELMSEDGKPFYQYPTLGMIPLYHNFGVEMSILPQFTGTSNIALLGLVFYEHDFWTGSDPFLKSV